MNTMQNQIRLFETVEGECPYLEGKQNASVFIDPEYPIDDELFSLLSRSGFRRSGEMLYAPKCPSCQACVSVRIPVQQFQFSRSQRRIWNKNSDLSVTIEDVCFKPEHFELYLNYQRARHSDSSMCDDDPEKYQEFIDSSFSRSKFVCFYHQERLIGISVVDQFKGGLSAVYTFFDPQESKRSLGTYSILYLIKLAQMKAIPYLYLGYWIEDSPKMAYKINFRPLEGYSNRRWHPLA